MLTRLIEEAKSLSQAIASEQLCLRVLYLFSGDVRRSDIHSALRQLCNSKVQLNMVEIDNLRDPVGGDLSQERQQEEVLADIGEGAYDVVICTSPCESWTRALFANRQGPRPCRSKDWPWGFPWAAPKNRARAELGNIFIMFTIRIFNTIKDLRRRTGHITRAFYEHPEDLGRAELGIPASTFQLKDLRAVVDKDFKTFAYFQCFFAATSSKPTRSISDISRHHRALSLHLACFRRRLQVHRPLAAQMRPSSRAAHGEANIDFFRYSWIGSLFSGHVPLDCSAHLLGLCCTTRAPAKSSEQRTASAAPLLATRCLFFGYPFLKLSYDQRLPPCGRDIFEQGAGFRHR